MRSCEPTVVRWRWMASHGARDGGREADAVLGVADVVVHRLRDGDDLDAELVELGRIAERVVAADGDQVVDAERLEVRQHLAGDVVGLVAMPPLVLSEAGKSLPSRWAGSFFILDGLVRLDVQEGAAASGRWCACCRGSAGGCSGPCWPGRRG